jgi:asparagine synthetase B (glutamine-hydrolysing)
MCGILFSSKEIKELEKILKYLKKRGPDHTEYKIIKNYHFIHVLLSMTGENYTIQPFVYDEVVVMFNGEIYNFKDFGDFNSDGECIIEAYKKHGDDFVRYLEGEFALLLIDFSKDILYYSTDIFSIKPLWFAQDGDDVGLCSYSSSLEYLGFQNIKQVDANTTIKMKLSTREVLTKQTVYDFDLKQHKNNFDDWNKAFENAIVKRTKGLKHKVFIGLSGGYDSGLISCVLNKLDIDYTAYTILGSEDMELMKQRHSLLKKGEIIDMTQEEFNSNKGFLEEFSEEYILKIENGEKENYIKCLMNNNENKANIFLKQYKYRMTGQKITNDNGAVGVSYICSKAKPKGEIIYLSGSGADEIVSDYGFNGVKHYGHSTIGGKFPEDLSSVFPWKNFFGNTQRAYLMKEETVSGTWGVEGRYPFLDKQVVQEFLWLSAELKNKNYKSPIHNYLTTHNYPFENGIKVGFNCGFKGQQNDFKKIDETNNQIDKTHVGNSKNNRSDLIVDFDEIEKINQYIVDNNIKFDFKNIFKIGCCRMNLKDYFITNNFEYNYSYSHTSKEVLQWLDILENKINFLDIPYIELCIQNKDNFDVTKYQKIYQQSDILLIDISSLKIISYNKFYYNMDYFYREIKQDEKLKEIINKNIQTEEDLYQDLLKIQQKAFPKKVIFVGHLLMDFYDLPEFNSNSREKIDNVLRKMSNFIVLADLFKDRDYKDIFDNDADHLKESSKKIIANKILEII